MPSLVGSEMCIRDRFKQAVVAASDGCIAAMSIDRYLNSRKNIRVDWIHS